jgi:hypothetical protein
MSNETQLQVTHSQHKQSNVVFFFYEANLFVTSSNNAFKHGDGAFFYSCALSFSASFSTMALYSMPRSMFLPAAT